LRTYLLTGCVTAVLLGLGVIGSALGSTLALAFLVINVCCAFYLFLVPRQFLRENGMLEPADLEVNRPSRKTVKKEEA
jgi:threonine/homoserine/homoserine lactone efflux protein